ncbi:MAG: nucleotidyltransferase family protein [Nitrospirae bacterium]|nr:nucleotidyltransferase family protein [Nitrospirota bacterium]
MKTFEEIKGILIRKKDEVLGKYKVKEIGIFGSVVRGETKQKSDIDILVDFYEIPDLIKFIELEGYLEKLLKSRVDLVDKQGLKPRIKETILSEVFYI